MLFADTIGLPLTCFLTVTWPSVGSFDPADPANWALHHKRLTAAIRKYADHHGFAPAYMCVRERARGRGAHTHFLLYLPARHPDHPTSPRAAWQRHATDLRECIHAACGFTDPQATHINHGGSQSPAQRLGVFQYLCEGLNPDELVALSASDTIPLPEWLGIKPKRQAMIPTDRVLWSPNIGPAVRQRAGYRDTEDVLSFGRALGAQ